MAKHLVAQNKTYGSQSLINLINQKGHEKPIKDAYERYIAEVREQSLFFILRISTTSHAAGPA